MVGIEDGRWKKYYWISDKEVKAEQFCFTQDAIFFTDKQELIQTQNTLFWCHLCG